MKKLFDEKLYQLLELADSGYYSKQLSDMRIDMEDVPNWLWITSDERCALGARRIVESCPIQINDYEKIIGSSTLLKAALHRFPATYKDVHYSSVSHTTLTYTHILKDGYSEMLKQVEEKLSDKTLELQKVRFLQSMKSIIESEEIFHKRYLDLLREKIATSQGELKKNYEEVYENFCDVPYYGAKNFKQAVQSLWFQFAFLRTLGGWPGIGRIDEFLISYYEKDLKEGKITYEVAREYLAHFWVKGMEWARISSSDGTGDGQFLQNVILSGITKDGTHLENAITNMVLDIVEDTGIGDFPISIRLNQFTSEALYYRIAKIVKQGRGILAVYNENLVINNLVDFGFPYEDAVNFTNDGCWEILIPGKTCFSYHSFDGYRVFQEAVGISDGFQPKDFNSIEEIYEAFGDKMGEKLDWIKNRTRQVMFERSERRPSVHMCIFIQDILKRCKNYFAGGTEYTVRAPHPAGFAEIGNSINAINLICFVEKKYSVQEFLTIVQNNFEGHEELRLHIWNTLSFYGNDDDVADSYVQRAFQIFKDVNGREKMRHNIYFPSGSSSFTRELSEYLKDRAASPFGLKRNTVLSTNASPTPGTDIKGPTSALKSFCKLGFKGFPNGTALDLKISGKTVEGENGTRALVALYKSFLKLDGIFMQPDVVNNELLIKAYENPEQYQNLSLRISGWSCRFVTLEKKHQKLMIDRTLQEV